MGAAAALDAIDLLIKGIIAVTNALGAGQKVSDMIAARIAAGAKDWTPEQRQAVRDDLAASKLYAQQELAKPDAP